MSETRITQLYEMIGWLKCFREYEGEEERYYTEILALMMAATNQPDEEQVQTLVQFRAMLYDLWCQQRSLDEANTLSHYMHVLKETIEAHSNIQLQP